jgi:PAS domain S-box-containing protein
VLTRLFDRAERLIADGHEKAVHYVFAVVVVGGAFLFRLALHPAAGSGVAFLFLYPAIFMAGWFGGMRPGLTATFLATALAAYFLRSNPGGAFAFQIPIAIQLLVFFGSCSLFCLLMGMMHHLVTKQKKAREEIAAQHESFTQAHVQSEFFAQLTQKLSVVSGSAKLNAIATSEIGRFLKAHRCYFFDAYPDIHHARVLTDWCRDAEPSIVGVYTLSEFGVPEWWAAVRNGPVSVDDIRVHELTKNFVPKYEALKIAAYSLSPFIHEGQWKACISVTSDQPRVWTAEEKTLLENVVARVWPLLERAQIEEALRRNEEALSRIAAVVESSDDAIVTKSLEGIILSWNAGAERIFGYKPSEIIGKSILTLIPPELQAEEPRIIERLKKGERIKHYETIRVGKTGQRLDISLTISPVKDRLGNIIAASKIARDVTEEKRRQQALRESEARFRSELERQVEERTASLQEALSQMEAFSYSISHDMRAPLRSMIHYAEMLKEDCAPKLDAPEVEYLNRISNAGQRMDQLIQDVLVYSRLNREEIVLRPIDADALLREIVHSYPNLQPELVTITIKHKLPAVTANEALLTQCFSNLLENGAKFVAQDTKPQIEVWSEETDGKVKLFFKDNGIGIALHQLERIFEIFQRVGRDTKGTGIGLAIVRRAIEKMRGRVGVQSDLGHGSLFWLELNSA